MTIEPKSLFYLSTLPKGHVLLICTRDRASEDAIENFLAMDIVTSDPKTGEYFRIVVNQSRFWRDDWENIVGVYAAADHSQVLKNLTYEEMIEAGAEIDKPEEDEDFMLTSDQLVEWAPKFLVWELGELAANEKDYFTLRVL